MDKEFASVVAMGTWELVPREPHMRVIGCRWVFAHKLAEDGTIASYKARLVAKGYAQQQGIDYDATFSPTARPHSFRLLLALAAKRGYSTAQADVSSAYLNAPVQEHVFMAQPEGFVQSPDGRGVGLSTQNRVFMALSSLAETGIIGLLTGFWLRAL